MSQQAAGDAGAVAPDVAKAVYALAAASGSETAYNTLVDMYEQVGFCVQRFKNMFVLPWHALVTFGLVHACQVASAHSA